MGHSQSQMMPHKVNTSQDDEMEIFGYKKSRRRFLTYVLIVMTGGLLLLLLTWRKSIKLAMTHRLCEPKDAEKLLLKNNYQQMYEETIQRTIDQDDNSQKVTWFRNKEIKYVWNEGMLQFEKLVPFGSDKTRAQIANMIRGLDDQTARKRANTYDENKIKISVHSVLSLIFQEAVNPFYIFQLYAVILWSVQQYYNFAIIIACLSIVSIGLSVWETRKQSRKLRDTYMKSQSEVCVLRNGTDVYLSSEKLVPGDIILIPQGRCILECDAVLLSGSCTVNEAMLTGESLPVTKVPILADDETFDYSRNKNNVLFCGTELLQGRPTINDYNGLPAVVVRTGFMTMKGELVRSILYPKPVDFQFYSDFMKCVWIFLGFGCIGMAYSFWIWTSNKGTLLEIFLNSFDILTFVIPPSLPAAVTAINSFAQRRLKKLKLFCLSSKYISLCGGIDLVCFDKTGTLTEESVDLASIIRVQKGEIEAPLRDPSSLQIDSPLVIALAACHSLVRIDGELVGSPADMKLFQAVRWDLIEHQGINMDYGGIATPILVRPQRENSDPDLEVAILRIFPFESEMQRITVLALRRDAIPDIDASETESTAGEQQILVDVYIKGAPEKIASICHPSTVPHSLSNALRWYGRQGLRVMALAWKPDQPLDGKREDVEKDATFLGLVLLQNLVKKETPLALQLLKNADIGTVMVTGDNLLTALSVARAAGLIQERVIIAQAKIIPSSLQAAQHVQVSFYDPEADCSNIITKSELKSVTGSNYVFAVDGTSFQLLREYDNDTFQKVVHRGRIFARMLPDQKIHLVEALQKHGHQVAMCGDGFNDCGALKAAHAGVSLSTAEASVAAPFTSRDRNIQCIPALLREGRATLVSAQACFKYGTAYCFTQFISTLMMFYIATEPHDNQYLIIDFILAAIPLMLMGDVSAADALTKQRPSRHILSFVPLFSVVSFICLQTGIYILVWFYCQAQPWFEPFVFVPGELPKPSYEQTSVFLTNAFSYVIAAVIYSKGAPFRKTVFLNVLFDVWLILVVILLVVMTMVQADWVVDTLHLRSSPEIGYNWVLLFVGAVNFCLCYVWERWLIDEVMENTLMPSVRKVLGPRRPYEKLEQELQEKEGVWPVLTAEQLGESDGDHGDTSPTPYKTETSPSWHNGSYDRESLVIDQPPFRLSSTQSPISDRNYSPGTDNKSPSGKSNKLGRFSFQTFGRGRNASKKHKDNYEDVRLNSRPNSNGTVPDASFQPLLASPSKDDDDERNRDTLLPPPPPPPADVVLNMELQENQIGRDSYAFPPPPTPLLTPAPPPPSPPSPPHSP